MLDKAGLVGSSFCPGKNDWKTGGIFYGMFLAAKVKYCLTSTEFRFMEEHKPFKNFNDSKRLLNCSQYFNMFEAKKISYVTYKLGKNHLIMESSYHQQ